tara:strand:+ start:32 stop:466 length:435 start_codon:yes stop_codon:yes gene_type:complete
MLGIASLAARLGLRAAPGLTRVWRGVEPAAAVSRSPMLGTSYPKGLKGRFFTTHLPDAKWYAHRKGTKSGLVQYLDLPQKQFNIAHKLSERLDIPRLGGQVIIPKKYLTSGNISTDYIKTIAARLRSIMGDHLNKGGLAGILEV